jgi:hypothetical protein
MGMPAVLSQNGTGTVYWNPDWFQDPFSVGIALVNGTSTGTATVDATLDDINGSLGTSGAHWFTVVTAPLGVATLATANFTTPCQWMRLNVVGTALCTATLVQAQFPR